MGKLYSEKMKSEGMESGEPKTEALNLRHEI